MTAAVTAVTSARWLYVRPASTRRGSERGDPRVADRSKMSDGPQPQLPGIRSHAAPPGSRPGARAAAGRLVNKVSNRLRRTPPPEHCQKVFLPSNILCNSLLCMDFIRAHRWKVHCFCQPDQQATEHVPRADAQGSKPSQSVAAELLSERHGTRNGQEVRPGVWQGRRIWTSQVIITQWAGIPGQGTGHQARSGLIEEGGVRRRISDVPHWIRAGVQGSKIGAWNSYEWELIVQPFRQKVVRRSHFKKSGDTIHPKCRL